ncbi:MULTISPECIES: hypothetical protein [unclassified Ruminococcus]|uniref:hypothetical protein n=1 Tax=unclassified Ruminococcus TaxID=2608920 RepID=UPI00210D62CF|nr:MULTISPECIES: hypothetical protein [unclassified Ruminococcus]MCQ4022489.1 hypothetical protein [Ruminococcus sp. zg-924]MCQ4115168.1 hypothetical protein [Ruminococcus sp. zg-921]
MGNCYYQSYKNHCIELEQIMKQNHGDSKDAKKLRGAIAVELLKQELTKYFLNNNEPFKTSSVNSYIAGSKYEYDLLIVKEDAAPYLGLVYQPKDVIAVIESKAGGLFDVDKNTSSIALAVNRALGINSNIKFGYITMSENVPVKNYNKNGKPTVRHWDLTKKYLREKINEYVIVYAVTLHKGKLLIDEGSDNEFYDFINALIEK